MKVFVRNMALILFVWLMLAGVCLAKQVYLMDGSIIDAQSAWRRGNKVFVKVNRDIVADFNASEIDLQRTFPTTAKRSKTVKHSHHVRRKAAAHAVTVAKTSAKVPVKPVSKVSIPAPQPAAPVAVATPVPQSVAPPTTHIPLPASTAPAQPSAAPSTSTAPASPPDKAELDRRKQEAVKMMTEAVMKRDPELMKKALEMQKSAMPQPGAGGLNNVGFPLYVPLVFLAVCLLFIVIHWIIFERAGQAGWKSLIPFYNTYIFMEIAGKPGWWMFLLIVPLVNIAIYFLAMLSLAKKFGRSELFGVGIAILPFIFLPVLAFGGSQYEG
jgi:hypothetical protein